MAFPSFHSCMQHVVINKKAQQDLSFRKGLSSTLIPNVFDFDNPPPPVDDYSVMFVKSWASVKIKFLFCSQRA